MKGSFVGRLTATAVLIGCATTSASAAWTETHKLTASDGARSDHFSNSVAISGNTAIVGSRLEVESGILSGSAYLYDVTTGNQLAKLTSSD